MSQQSTLRVQTVPWFVRILNPHVDLEMCDRPRSQTWQRQPLRNAMFPTESINYRLPSTFTG